MFLKVHWQKFATGSKMLCRFIILYIEKMGANLNTIVYDCNLDSQVFSLNVLNVIVVIISMPTYAVSISIGFIAC